jgi:hypothetical protein
MQVQVRYPIIYVIDRPMEIERPKSVSKRFASTSKVTYNLKRFHFISLSLNLIQTIGYTNLEAVYPQYVLAALCPH